MNAPDAAVPGPDLRTTITGRTLWRAAFIEAAAG